jgi:hypothetical protein
MIESGKAAKRTTNAPSRIRVDLGMAQEAPPFAAVGLGWSRVPHRTYHFSLLLRNRRILSDARKMLANPGTTRARAVVAAIDVYVPYTDINKAVR